jgi:hypothetical protein
MTIEQLQRFIRATADMLQEGAGGAHGVVRRTERANKAVTLEQRLALAREIDARSRTRIVITESPTRCRVRSSTASGLAREGLA